jgi:hypothetical protein
MSKSTLIGLIASTGSALMPAAALLAFLVISAL